MCAVIAQSAVAKARKDIQGRGWRSSGSLQPVSNNGTVGIQSTVKYLMYQNKGFEPFLMTWVRDRVVPLGCKQGDGPHFAKGKGVGEPGFVNIPHRGRVWRNQKWRHPGLKPKRFMESAITAAIKENKDFIRREVSDMVTGRRKEGAKWLD